MHPHASNQTKAIVRVGDAVLDAGAFWLRMPTLTLLVIELEKFQPLGNDLQPREAAPSTRVR
jgi:hypothetical protein